MLACFGMEDNKVLILDMRSPGQPVAELVGHQGPLNAIAWGNGGMEMGDTGGGWLASCSKFSSSVLSYHSRQSSRHQLIIKATTPNYCYTI